MKNCIQNWFVVLVVMVSLATVGSVQVSAQETLEAPVPQLQEEQEEQLLEDDASNDLQEPEDETDEGDAENPDEPKKSEKQTDDDDESKKSDEKAKDEDADKPERSDDSNRRRRRRSRRQGNLTFTKKSELFVSAFTPVVSATSESVVRILNNEKQIALGTVVDSEGLILTKASELEGKLKCELSDGSKHVPSIVGIDPTTDLVLLKIQKSGMIAVKFNDENAPVDGSWLATVGVDEKPIAIGIVSHKPRRIRNNVPNPAVIGIQLQDRTEGDGVRINQVLTNRPGEKAGLLVNDIVIGIDGKEILNREQLNRELSFYQPSEEIILKIKRGEEIKEIPVTLGRRRTNGMANRGIRQNEMGSTLSERRSDFPLALQHDTALDANQCGGPIVDIEGNVIGINIARDGRVSTLAIPNEALLPVIETLKKGDQLPEVVFKEDIQRVERKLVQLAAKLKPLPDKKMEKELEHSAGAALEDELMKQIEDAEKRLEALRDRFRETRTSNKALKDAIKLLKNKQKDLESRRDPLQKNLKKLKTGVK